MCGAPTFSLTTKKLTLQGVKMEITIIGTVIYKCGTYIQFSNMYVICNNMCNNK